MKRIKMLAAAAIFCTAGLAGYAAYDRATMTNEEKFMLANLEALTSESGEFHGTRTCASGTSDVYNGMLYMVCGSCPTMQYLINRTEGVCSW